MRLLGHGELRYVILYLLNEKPRHGYELMKDLEDLSHGAYSPSPGTIYPTLTFLEEVGFASVSMDDNKKLYSITAEGKSHIKEQKESIQELVEKFSTQGEKMSRLKSWVGKNEIEEVANENRPSIRRSMHRMKMELFSMIDAKPEVKNKVVQIIDRAIDEIKNIKR